MTTSTGLESWTKTEKAPEKNLGGLFPFYLKVQAHAGTPSPTAMNPNPVELASRKTSKVTMTQRLARAAIAGSEPSTRFLSFLRCLVAIFPVSFSQKCGKTISI